MKCHIHDCPDSIYENDLCIFHCPKGDWFEIVEGNKDWTKSQDKIDLKCDDKAYIFFDLPFHHCFA